MLGIRLIGTVAFAAFMLAYPADRPQAGETISLPAPRMEGGMPMMEALSKRQSIRAYRDEALNEQTLSDLLWAAFGINRPEAGERTAPSWRGSKEIDIYAARADGVWLYEPKSHALKLVLQQDVREATGRQPFPATAPLVLIYVADRSRMADAPQAEQYTYAHVDAALIAQNVYLFAASEGLGTVMLGNVEKEALVRTLKLRKDQILTFTQPIGRPE